MDHATIFVFIAASYTPVALLVLEPPMRTIVLVVRLGGRRGGRGAEPGLDHARRGC